MNLRDFFSRKTDKEQHLTRMPYQMYPAPFAEILNSFDEDVVEDIVAENFNKILPYRRVEEYHFFALYPKWRTLFGKHLEAFLSNLCFFDEVKPLLVLFPEYTSDIYSYVLALWLDTEDESNSFVHSLRIIEDVLRPMADLERYQNYYFPQIREQALSIVKRTEYYEDLWNVLFLLEEYFGIKREVFDEELHNVFDSAVNDLKRPLREKEMGLYTTDDCDWLKSFLTDKEAYEFLMDHLPALTHIAGIEFYTVLLKVIGPIPEILNLYHYCPELSDPIQLE